MPDKCDEYCPFCAELVAEDQCFHRVYPASYGKYQGKPRCGQCGAHLVEGQWIKECVTCGEQVDELYGPFIPHNCHDCQQKAIEADRTAGRVCPRCRKVYSNCYC